MKNSRSKNLVCLLFGLLCLIVLIKAVDILKPKQQATPSTSEIFFENREIITRGISSDEEKRIASFIDTFERAIAQKDAEKVLSFFSQPETDEEQDALDFILGTDLAQVGITESKRLFVTAGYNFNRAANYVRAIIARDTNRRVLVDELRIVPSNGEWVGYIVKVSHLVIELRETPYGYQIVQYYHDNSPQIFVRKYEGFLAE